MCLVPTSWKELMTVQIECARDVDVHLLANPTLEHAMSKVPMRWVGRQGPRQDAR